MNKPVWQSKDRVQRAEGKTSIGIVESIDDRTGYIYVTVRWCDTRRTSVVRADRLKRAPKE